MMQRNQSAHSTWTQAVPGSDPGGVRTPIALHCGSSISNMAMKAVEIGRFWLNIPKKLGCSFLLSPLVNMILFIVNV